ncbi:hypothetical protein V9T40_000189 [Parthenolecanium corni]|uniref:Uncharacterized protein n=1 Tax=Parthenolecanium corni TaxID=536013 RepID=A0AAN9TB75_9HEMI
MVEVAAAAAAAARRKKVASIYKERLIVPFAYARRRSSLSSLAIRLPHCRIPAFCSHPPGLRDRQSLLVLSITRHRVHPTPPHPTATPQLPTPRHATRLDSITLLDVDIGQPD